MTLTMLVPLDGSATAEAALPVAQQLATAAGGSVVLLRVTAPAHATGYVEPVSAAAAVGGRGFYRAPRVHELETVTQAASRLESEAQDYLAMVAERLVGVPVHRRVRDGANVAEAIVAAAAAAGADLIVLASHGHTGLRHRLLGGVAEQVLGRSHVPVVLVRPPTPAE